MIKNASDSSESGSEYEIQDHSDNGSDIDRISKPIQTAELSVDVHETRNGYIIKTVTAGVRRGDLNMSITRESLTISGERILPPHLRKEDIVIQELYWGPFERTVIFPEEVDIDLAEAKEANGILTISIPRIDPNRAMDLKVNS
jgi:HSP20 family protein